MLIIVIFLCRWFDWDTIESNDVHKLSLRSSERILSQLQNVGQQLALTFNNEGSVLAVGGEVETIFHINLIYFNVLLPFVHESKEKNHHYAIRGRVLD